ncbi:OLC1v1030019C7 [Oldenlandia corymbosa var. corymbosa]|uniref:OLC1v1030019C7 n=2 Tax=Oldenlandia corymbosa var. corymbosa TaxID=529605 RepID=A0AAV1CI61_OLDCO|nr:OLC1v1030019C7 [Oldenlandia corymbosa var. corymbosa]
MDSRLIQMCIEAAAESSDAVEAWRRQRRTLERMPSLLAEALLHRLLHRGLLFPSLLEVFRHSVEKMDLRGQNCVDAEWMAYLGSFHYLSSLNLADCYKISGAALWSIIGITNLKELDLSRCSKMNDAGIRHLSSFPSLERLCISETGVSSEGIRLLSSLTNLYYLDLGGLAVSDLALSSLQGLKKLQFLDLWGSEISNSGAALLQYFPKLSSLNLAWTKVTKLPNLSSLEFLNLSNCTITSIFKGEGDKARLAKLVASNATFADVSGALSNVEIAFLSHLDLSNALIDSFCFLPHLTSVTYLDLGGSPMADDSVENIVCIGAKLTYLSLNNTKVSSEGMEILAGHLPNLETLLLSGTYIDDAAISYIGMMPSLKAINLSGTKIKGLIMQEGSDSSWVPTFSALQNLSQLERLELEGMQLKDAALYPFSILNSLTYLSLQSVILTDESLLLLSASQKLEHLAIRDAVLTNAGLNSFTPPPNLRVLDVRGGWLLTEDAIVLFSRKYPNIKLRHELAVSDRGGDFRYSSPAAQKTVSLKNARKFSVSPPVFDKSALLGKDLLELSPSTVRCSL